MFASLFNVFDNLYIPSADPIASISLFVCPMTNTLSDSSINFTNAVETVLALTLVLFSTSSVLPPKNSYFWSCFIIAWSPPLPSAISCTACADLYFSSSVSPSFEKEMLNVAWIPSNICSSLICCKIFILSFFAFSKFLLSITT